MFRLQRSPRPALLAAALIIAASIAVVAGSGKCGPTTGSAIFGTSQSKIIGVDAVMLPPPENPKQDLRLTVSVAVTYDATNRIYTYAYTVENENQSGNALDVFGLAPLGDPVDIGAPSHWAGDNRW